MCWNSTVSLNTFLFSLFGGSFAYFNKVISFSIFLYFLSFISIQLVEYFTWKNLHNQTVNRLLSQVAAFLIFIQIPLFVTCTLNYEEQPFVLGLYFLFSAFVYFSFPIDFSMKKAANGHLAWNWLKFPTWVIATWLSFLLGSLFYVKKYVDFALYSVVIAAIYYTYYKSNTWGSLWCWISNILALKWISQVFLKDLCV